MKSAAHDNTLIYLSTSQLLTNIEMVRGAYWKQPPGIGREWRILSNNFLKTTTTSRDRSLFFRIPLSLVEDKNVCMKLAMTHKVGKNISMVPILLFHQFYRGREKWVSLFIQIVFFIFFQILFLSFCILTEKLEFHTECSFDTFARLNAKQEELATCWKFFRNVTYFKFITHLAGDINSCGFEIFYGLINNIKVIGFNGEKSRTMVMKFHYIGMFLRKLTITTFCLLLTSWQASECC